MMDEILIGAADWGPLKAMLSENITGKLDGSAMGSGNQVLEGKMIASGAIGTTYQQRQWSGDQGGWGEQSVSFDFDASRVVPTANENRPRNVALLACIKY